MNMIDKGSKLHRRIIFISQILLGGIFVVAALGKFENIKLFAQTIKDYRLVPTVAALPLSIALPIIELIFGVTLILNFYPRLSALVLSGLLVIFILTFFINMVRGINVDCGCFSNLIAQKEINKSSNWLYIVRDLVFLIPGVVILLNKGSSTERDKR